MGNFYALPYPQRKRIQVSPDHAEAELSRELLRRLAPPAQIEVPAPEPTISRIDAGAIPQQEMPNESQPATRIVWPNLQRKMTNYGHGVTPSEQAAIDRKVVIPPDPTRPVVNRGGIVGTLKSIGRGALEGLAIGGEAGGAQAIGGAIAGALAGGVSPQAISDIHFKRIVLPEHERNKALAERDLANQEGLITKIGERTGYNPVTGTPTFEREKFGEQQALRETVAANTKAINEGRLAETARRNDAYIDKSEFDKQHKLTRLKQFEDGLKARTHKIVKDGRAQYVVDINDPTEAIQITDKDGKEIADPTSMLEGGRNYRFKEGQAQQNTRQQKQIEATRSNTEYVQGQQNTRQQQDFAQGKYQGKKKRSSLLDDEPTTQAAPPTSGYQVGQVVISNGKRYKITGINPDGSYKAIPQ